jgi:transcriptional regulator with XRE-family HTH domain
MTEHQKARAWREAHNLSMAELSKLSGYGVASIYWFEAGTTPPRTRKHMAGANLAKRKINAFCWMRYKLVCFAVEQQLRTGKKFEWGT